MRLAMLTLSTGPFSEWPQERTWEGLWELYPLGGMLAALAATVLLIVLFGWVVLHLAPLVLGIVAAVLGVRWLIRATDRSRSDPAVALLRERYARGEIDREEFDAKLRDLDGKA